jgi:hypothetical protein
MQGPVSTYNLSILALIHTYNATTAGRRCRPCSLDPFWVSFPRCHRDLESDQMPHPRCRVGMPSNAPIDSDMQGYDHRIRGRVRAQTCISAAVASDTPIDQLENATSSFLVGYGGRDYISTRAVALRRIPSHHVLALRLYVLQLRLLN